MTNDFERPSLASLHHVAITVANLSEAIEFYASGLGLVELETPSSVIEQGIRWFDLGQGRALHLIATSETAPASRAHFAITVDDVAAWQSYIERQGIKIIKPTIDLAGAKRFFLRDPAGNLLEFVEWLD